MNARYSLSVRRRSMAAIGRMDGVLLVSVGALCVIGTLLVWSSTGSGVGDPGLLRKHLLNMAAGAALGGAVAVMDHRWLRAYAPLLYGFCLAGLIAVLTPLGATINGSHSWITIGGGFALQPSEFAKPALILGIAVLLAELREGEERPGIRSVMIALAAAALPTLLIVLQPDLGTVLVFGAITMGMVVLSGVAKRWLIALVAALGGVLAAVWSLGLLQSYQVSRFTSFLDPAADLEGSGYNGRQALITIGSGELFGKGLFHGGQTIGRFVPEQHNDFVFTVAGEELGFAGAVTIVVLLGVVLLRGLRIARECDDRFGVLVAGGIVCWLAFQSFINIGMTLGIMPITGLPLPFVSYGGSSIFATMVAVGLLQSIHAVRIYAAPS